MVFFVLKWVYNIIFYGFLGNLVDIIFFCNIIEVSKCLFSRFINKKEFVIFDMIYCICFVFVCVDSNFKDLCLVLLFVLGFYGFFRISELLDL